MTRGILLLFSFVVGRVAAVAANSDAKERPNIVLMLSESLDGRLLRPDSPALIPNIRALMSQQSVRFDTAYSNNPVCAPSRSSMWSGRAPHKIVHEHNGMQVNGVWNNYEGLPSDYTSRMDQMLGAAGYSTLVAGKTDWTVGGHTESCFLESFTFNVAWPYNITASGGWNQEETMCASSGEIDPGGSPGPKDSSYGGDWKIVESLAAFVKSAAQPFFGFSGTSILHPPYRTTEYWHGVANASHKLPEWPPLSSVHPCDLQAASKRGCTPGHDNETAYALFNDPARISRIRRIYLAELEEFDAMVGAVVKALQDSGRANNTYLVIAADHGDMQLEHQMFYKMVPYDASSRVPIVFASAGALPAAGAVVQQPVQLLDIFPTLLGLAGVPIPSYADGYDLSPFLQGGQIDPSRPPTVAFQNHDEDISMSWFAVSDGAHKLIQYGTGAEVPPQLFNLTADPEELVNLFNTSDAARTLTAALDAALRSDIDYPSVALDVAAYQRAQFLYWVSTTGPAWRTDIATVPRWAYAWSLYPNQV